jgi:hypothetical protein
MFSFGRKKQFGIWKTVRIEELSWMIYVLQPT